MLTSGQSEAFELLVSRLTTDEQIEAARLFIERLHYADKYCLKSACDKAEARVKGGFGPSDPRLQPSLL